jgi:hypothetical protein
MIRSGNKEAKLRKNYYPKDKFNMVIRIKGPIVRITDSTTQGQKGDNSSIASEKRDLRKSFAT